jgi:hypothetical protein
MHKQDKLEHSYLISVLDYNTNTGIFTNKIARGPAQKGIESGYKTKAGYREISLKNTRYYSHRLAWFYMYKEWPENQIDHINGIKDDNRKCNLREATAKNNMANQKAHKDSTSIFTGVSWAQDRNKWRATICSNGITKKLGSFETEIEAAIAYNIAATEYHGEFAQLNKV